MSANDNNKDMKKEPERQEDGEEDYKQKYLALLYQVKRGKDAIENLVRNWWTDEVNNRGG